MIETDRKTYRVEQYIEGRPFTYLDLSQPKIYRQCAKLICEFNNTAELKQFATQNCDKLKALEFIADRERGWYWKARGILQNLFSAKKDLLEPA